MKDDHLITDAAVFAVFAGNDFDRWQLAVGAEIQHSKWGQGEIERILRSNAEKPFIATKFKSDDRPFRLLDPDIFKDPLRLLSMKVPTDVAIDSLAQARTKLKDHVERVARADDKKRQQERDSKERRARIDRAKILRQKNQMLLNKYAVSEHRVPHQRFRRLLEILECLDNDQALDVNDLGFLERCELYGPIAAHHESMFYRTKRKGELARASSYWIRAGMPSRALRAVDQAGELNLIRNLEIRASLLTTRGAALRRLMLLDEAESCARTAIDLRPYDPHAYRVLGAIENQRGNHLAGERHFKMAEERTSNSAMIVDEF